jgi:hypothetical protein
MTPGSLTNIRRAVSRLMLSMSATCAIDKNSSAISRDYRILRLFPFGVEVCKSIFQKGVMSLFFNYLERQ